MLRVASYISLLIYTLSVAAPDLDKMLRLAQQRYGAQGAQTVQQWRTLVQEAQGLSEADKILRVNEFFNRHIAFRDDMEVWGVADYWATPLESMGRGAGDCEDYSIAKYATLKLLHVPIDRMRLVYVRARIGTGFNSVSQAHMVLSYYPTPEADPLILDNLVTEIKPASRRPDLYPVFSFNGEGLWVSSSPTSGSSGSSTARLSKWRDVIIRMQEEGLE
jgi:predicted transglutaminase-like cysteine proteinase